ncbi:Bromodomain containing protein [Tritrichomonas foetus]|uniref:Bromodomain containing protein n=1 Tax=Tritrichomonas foetus TaxID=1144522 RepID=A0A1J4K554_9EUKA|nr:Bromodomain containing protein [Tritrichomonas foetus]|eukprot:OHT06577.1 Bromodomain containing protein [Tritrichomonas foetus]
MSSHLLSRCKALTSDLTERPLNSYFIDPVKNLDNYFEIIKTPMDYRTINNNLKNDKYSSALEWYNDVCLIYDNAMTYHPKGSVFHSIAKYNKKEFQKLALGIGCPDPQSWYDLTCKTMQKLSTAIANGPVPQGIDPLLLSIVKKAELMPPPTPQLIADLVAKINGKLEDQNIKLDVMSLLKETQPSLKIDGEKLTIDADSLSDITLNALSLYVKAH